MYCFLTKTGKLRKNYLEVCQYILTSKMDGEVFCWLFKNYDRLDCLRSPHLYKEHAIRFNIANKAYGERVEKIREWFTTNGVYTSTYDLMLFLYA